MKKKFACIDFINSRDEIPINYIFKNLFSDTILKWYVKKKDIFLIKEMLLEDEEGYYVKILVPKHKIYEDEKYTKEIIEKTFFFLNELDVDIINILYNYKFDFQNKFYIASKESIMPFFIMDIIKKYIKIVNKQMKDIQILLIADEDNKEYTNVILDIIYPSINYLSILTDTKLQEHYKNKSEVIFADTGLTVHLITDTNSQIIKQADVIINTSNKNRICNILNKGTIFIDLNKNKDNLIDIASKREDILFVDDVEISYNNETWELKNIDMYLFLKLKYYRNLYKSRYYRVDNIEIIKNYINKKRISISSIKLLDKHINEAWIERFLNSSNLKSTSIL